MADPSTKSRTKGLDGMGQAASAPLTRQLAHATSQVRHALLRDLEPDSTTGEGQCAAQKPALPWACACAFLCIDLQWPSPAPDIAPSAALAGVIQVH